MVIFFTCVRPFRGSRWTRNAKYTNVAFVKSVKRKLFWLKCGVLLFGIACFVATAFTKEVKTNMGLVNGSYVHHGTDTGILGRHNDDGRGTCFDLHAEAANPPRRRSSEKEFGFLRNVCRVQPVSGVDAVFGGETVGSGSGSYSDDEVQLDAGSTGLPSQPGTGTEEFVRYVWQTPPILLVVCELEGRWWLYTDQP